MALSALSQYAYLEFLDDIVFGGQQGCHIQCKDSISFVKHFGCCSQLDKSISLADRLYGIWSRSTHNWTSDDSGQNPHRSSLLLRRSLFRELISLLRFVTDIILQRLELFSSLQKQVAGGYSCLFSRLALL